MSTRRPPPATIRRLRKSSGMLSSQVVQRMNDELPWFQAMSAENRSWVGMVAHAGIASFIDWLGKPGRPAELAGEVFGAAPREAARAITLQQTVELVRLTVDVIESQVDELAAPGEESLLREGVLRFSREIAFAAAGIYASSAEERGAWDARLEALLIDELLRGEADAQLASRASALGWHTPESVVVVVGTSLHDAPDDALEALRRALRGSGVSTLAGVHGNLLIAVVGGAGTEAGAILDLATSACPVFGPGPVVVGPPVPDLASAHRSAAAALSGVAAAAAWPHAPRPVLADDLLPERALAGDLTARTALIDEIYKPLAAHGSPLLETVSCYVESGASLEATARALFLHPNTVRYRLGKIADLIGFSPTSPRDAFTIRIAIALAHLDDGLRPL